MIPRKFQDTLTMTPMAHPLPDEWYYLDGSNPVGPFTRDVMRQLGNAGLVTDQTLIRLQSNGSWQEFGLSPLIGNIASSDSNTAGFAVEQSTHPFNIGPSSSQIDVPKVVSELGRKVVDYTKDLSPYMNKARESLWLFLQRIRSTGAVQHGPTAKESALLESSGISDSESRIHMTWRRSLLNVGMIATWVWIALIVPDLFTRLAWVVDEGPGLIVAAIFIFPYIMVGIASSQVRTSFKRWNEPEQSRRHALLAAGAIAAQQLPLAIVPMAAIDGSHDLGRRLTGIVFAVWFGALFLPTVVGLAFGLMRGCLAIRVFHPRNPLPATMLLVAGGLGLVIMLMISGLLVQMTGSILVSMSFLCLLSFVAMNAYAGYRLQSNLPPGTVMEIAGNVEGAGPFLIGLGALLALIGAWDFLKHIDFGAVAIIQACVAGVASFCIVTVAFSDCVTIVMRGPGEFDRAALPENAKSNG